MRGVFFQQPLGFTLEVSGEEWHQGDSLEGTLSIKNHSSSAQSLAGICLCLSFGKAKKIKDKASGAFENISTAELSLPAELGPEQDTSVPWNFKLDKNCAISEKSQGLYLVCGKGDPLDAIGRLALNIKVHSDVEALWSVFETAFYFELKTQKSVKGWSEAKLKPPGSQDSSLLEHLLLRSRFDGDALDLQYIFCVKSLEGMEETFGIRKSKKEFEQRLERSNYMLANDFINNAAIESAIKEAFLTIKSKF